MVVQNGCPLNGCLLSFLAASDRLFFNTESTQYALFVSLWLRHIKFIVKITVDWLKRRFNRGTQWHCSCTYETVWNGFIHFAILGWSIESTTWWAKTEIVRKAVVLWWLLDISFNQIHIWPEHQYLHYTLFFYPFLFDALRTLRYKEPVLWPFYLLNEGMPFDALGVKLIPTTCCMPSWITLICELCRYLWWNISY